MMKVRGFESTGLSREQAEAMTNLMTELLCNNKEKITESFVTKFAMEKVTIINMPGFTFHFIVMAMDC